MALTESLAMTPAASVSGFYLAHPEARYSTSAGSARTRLQDWAQRQGFDMPSARRHLAASL